MLTDQTILRIAPPLYLKIASLHFTLYVHIYMRVLGGHSYVEKFISNLSNSKYFYPSNIQKKNDKMLWRALKVARHKYFAKYIGTLSQLVLLDSLLSLIPNSLVVTQWIRQLGTGLYRCSSNTPTQIIRVIYFEKHRTQSLECLCLHVSAHFLLQKLLQIGFYRCQRNQRKWTIMIITKKLCQHIHLIMLYNQDDASIRMCWKITNTWWVFCCFLCIYNLFLQQRTTRGQDQNSWLGVGKQCIGSRKASFCH